MAQPRPQPNQPYNLNPEPIRWSLVAPFFALLAIFVPIPPAIVEEFYSRDMYPWLQNLFTGITNYLENGGTLEKAQQMAAHESAKTTKLYNRTNDAITLDEVERIAF